VSADPHEERSGRATMRQPGSRRSIGVKPARQAGKRPILSEKSVFLRENKQNFPFFFAARQMAI